MWLTTFTFTKYPSVNLENRIFIIVNLSVNLENRISVIVNYMYYMCVIHGTPSVPPLCFVYLIFKENQPAELKNAGKTTVDTFQHY